MAYVRSISEDRFPYMIDTDSQQALYWGSGSLLQHVLGSAAVRVSDNRIRFIPAGWVMLTIDDASAACHPHTDMLCIVDGGELNTGTGIGDMGIGTGSRVFPFYNTGVTVHSNTSHSCTHGSGRVSMAAPSEVYDVSVCDTVDGSLDVLFTHDRIQLIHVNINNPLYVISGVIVVLLIVFVTQNLSVDIIAHEDVGETAVSVDICMILSLVLTFCSSVLPGVMKGHTSGLFIPIVTYFDLYYFYLVLCYMAIHCIRWVKSVLSRYYCQYMGDHAHKTDDCRTGQLHSVNFMVSALLLSIFSTHGTIETVLTTPLLFVFMFRTIFKIYAIENSCDTTTNYSTHNTVEAFLIVLDCIVIAATHIVGTEPLAETYLHASSSFCIIFFLAHALAYEGNRGRRHVIGTVVTPGPDV
jgi:hypothetical protein